MLPKSKRLTTEEIESLSNGKSVFGTLISMRAIKSDTLKFAVSVSKKVAPLAVDRNRLRRKVYNSLPSLISEIKSPAFIMIMPKKEILTVSMDVLRLEIGTLLRRLGVV
jgi:ribonuclease P protein component